MEEYNFCKPEFWRKRLEESNFNYRDAIQIEPDWEASERGHKKVIHRFVEGNVLDAGCGYGRIIELLPTGRMIDYIGMDISPDFIEEAKRRYPDKKFIFGDIRKTDFKDKSFDWAIAVGMTGGAPWVEIEKELKRVAKHVLCLKISLPDDYTIL